MTNDQTPQQLGLDPLHAITVTLHHQSGEPPYCSLLVPAWKVRAVHALRTCERVTLPSEKWRYASQQPPTVVVGALVGAAKRIAEQALKCCEARQDLPSVPHRIGPEIYGGLSERRADARGYMAEHPPEVPPAIRALAIALDGVAAQPRRESEGMADPIADAHSIYAGLCVNALTYPNVEPGTEACIASDGCTASEYILDGAANLVLRIAELFRAVQGEQAPKFSEAADRAAALAQGAGRVIYAGVLQTLGGRPVLLNVATSAGK